MTDNALLYYNVNVNKVHNKVEAQSIRYHAKIGLSGQKTRVNVCFAEREVFRSRLFLGAVPSGL